MESDIQSRGTERVKRMISKLRNLGLAWGRGSLSKNNGKCVQIAELPEGGIAVRNSKNSEGADLRLTADEWNDFLARAKNGEFDGIAPNRPANLWDFLRWLLEHPSRAVLLTVLLAIVVIAAVLAQQRL
jgi:hypothetical protein